MSILKILQNFIFNQLHDEKIHDIKNSKLYFYEVQPHVRRKSNNINFDRKRVQLHKRRNLHLEINIKQVFNSKSNISDQIYRA